MNRQLSILALACVTAFTAPSAHAIAVQLAYGPINTQPADQGQGTVETWLANTVTAYNALNLTSLPAPGGQVFRVNQGDSAPIGFPTFGSGLLTLTIPGGYYDYLVLHWGGNPNLNTTYAFYIGNDGLNSTLTFNAPGQNGLSSYSLFHPTNRVPDAGSTALLLGLGLAFIAPFVRRTQRA